MEQLPERLQQQSVNTLPSTDSNEISLYTGALTTKAVVENVAKIKLAFPYLQSGFYDVFAGRLKDKGFCDERLRDAVNHVIDNCHYPQPSIADFINFDKTIKFKTWYEMTRDNDWDTYYPVKFPDRPKAVWIYANDISQYKLEKYIVK